MPLHPLAPDLSKLSDQELSDKLHDLWRRAALLRYHPAHTQIQALIHTYTVEFERRQIEKSNKQ